MQSNKISIRGKHLLLRPVFALIVLFAVYATMHHYSALLVPLRVSHHQLSWLQTPLDHLVPLDLSTFQTVQAARTFPALRTLKSLLHLLILLNL